MASDETDHVLFLIPARGGSRGLPGKNLATVGGVSLVARAVIVARRFAALLGVPSMVVVDTDDDDIVAEGLRWGGEVPFKRPPELARDATPTIENVLHMIDQLGPEVPVSTVVLLQPTSPLRTLSDLAACWDSFEGARSPSVVSVTSVDHPVALAMHRSDPDGVLTWVGNEPASVRRQDHPQAWWPNGAVYITSVELLRSTREFVIPGTSCGVPTPSFRSIDIDTMDDLRVARACAARGTSRPAFSGSTDRCPPILIRGNEGASEVWLEASDDLVGTVNNIFKRGLTHETVVRLGPFSTDGATRLRRGMAQIKPLWQLMDIPSVWIAGAREPHLVTAAAVGELAAAVVVADAAQREGLKAALGLFDTGTNFLDCED